MNEEIAAVLEELDVQPADHVVFTFAPAATAGRTILVIMDEGRRQWSAVAREGESWNIQLERPMAGEAG